MRYFLDTEFWERGPDHPIQLISIGIVAEDDHRGEFYAVNGNVAPGITDSWLLTNVVPHLESVYWMSSTSIANGVLDFIGKDPKPEFWAYYADYDWVVFCQLFGRMTDLPWNWPKYCLDIKQWAKQLGNPRLPKQEGTVHNALEDARHVKKMFKYLARFGSTDNV